APCDKHRPVRQQCRRVIITVVREAASTRPGAARWIVEFRAVKIETSRHKHLAIEQQDGGVKSAWGGEIAGGCPVAGCRVVEVGVSQPNLLRAMVACHAREVGVVAPSASSGEHITIGQQRRAMMEPGGLETAGSCPGAVY